MGVYSLNSSNVASSTVSTTDQKSLYQTRKEETAIKENIYRNLKDKLYAAQNSKYSLWRQLQSNPKDFGLKDKYTNSNKNCSDLSIKLDCAWWGLYGAINSQRKAISY